MITLFHTFQHFIHAHIEVIAFAYAMTLITSLTYNALRKH